MHYALFPKESHNLNLENMDIIVPKERGEDETRVAATPDSVGKFLKLGAKVIVESGAGEKSSILDSAYENAGATLASDPEKLYASDGIILKVGIPAEGEIDELSLMKKGSILLALLDPVKNKEKMKKLAERGVNAFSMEFIPRISRAQSMDVLSSQSNLAGYKAVVDAAAEYGSALPMMMTAAGTVTPAKVLILGAGVAGLQAVATAKRLGAIVSAFDVRPDVKEQVESLGGIFIEVESSETKDAETSGGYAKEMSEDYKKQQAALIHETLKKTDIAICTALIPGKPAPVLIPEEMVKDMQPGSVIVDMAVEAGGNCPISEVGKIVVKHGVKIMGQTNLPGRIATDASALYANNLVNFLTPFFDKETKEFKIDWEDEIIQGTCITRDGVVVHELVKEKEGN